MRTLLPTLLLLPLAWALAAQSPSEESQPERLVFDRLDVTRVNVEVRVTDKQGEPVTGLTAEDFELFEDGRRVEVTNFAAVTSRSEERRRARTEALRAATEAQPPAADEQPVAPQPPPEAAEPEIDPEERLSLVIFFDNLHLRPFNRNQVSRQVQSFLLRHMVEGDQAMLVTFERSLNVRTSFTSDQRKLLTALEEIETLSALGVQGGSSRREAIRRIEESRDALEARSHADFYAKEVHDAVLRSIAALQEQVEALAGLPGRKALLFVADGLPMNAGEDIFALADLRFQDQGVSGQLMASRYKSARQFRALTARANAHGVTFYTLEAAGNRAHESLSAEYAGNSSYLEIDTVRSANRRQPLMEIAHDTGGLAITGTNNFSGGLERVARDFDSYYSLAFQPRRSGSGEFRKIRVKVDKPGVTVRHRGGYTDKSIDTRMRETTVATLLYGSHGNDLGITVDLGEARPHEGDSYLVPLRVRIPLANLTLIQQGEYYRGEARVSIVVSDEEGGQSPVSQTPVPITIPASEIDVARASSYAYTGELLMRRGRQDVAVGIRDELAGETAFVRRRLRVGG